MIDEFDRMLDMGFVPDIERICRLVPFTRQTLFFTATMPAEIRRIVDTFLHNPIRIEVAKPATTNVTVTQLLAGSGADPAQKRETLRRLIRSVDGLKNAIVFCNRKRDVAVVHRSLVRHGFGALALHGDMDQPARTAALDQFRRGDSPLLIASDVAARGLDISDVSHVFNFDVPHHPDDYVHRIGRTARAGRLGTAITIVAPQDHKAVAAIEELTGQRIPWVDGNLKEGAEAPSRPRAHGPAKRQSGVARAAPTRKAEEKGPAIRKERTPKERSPTRTDSPRARDWGGHQSTHVPAFLLRPVALKA